MFNNEHELHSSLQLSYITSRVVGPLEYPPHIWGILFGECYGNVVVCFSDVSGTLHEKNMKKHCGNIQGILKQYPGNVLRMC